MSPFVCCIDAIRIRSEFCHNTTERFYSYPNTGSYTAGSSVEPIETFCICRPTYSLGLLCMTIFMDTKVQFSLALSTVKSALKPHCCDARAARICKSCFSP